MYVPHEQQFSKDSQQPITGGESTDASVLADTVTHHQQVFQGI